MREPAASQIIAGKYRIESLIGHGGMGSVWRAQHVTLGMPVAIKFMGEHATYDPESRQRFDREARALAALRTPHIVQVLDHGVDDDTPYIVMELLEGEDLSSRLQRERRLPLADTSRILAQVARALRRAHEAGVTHRDLKPSNIFLANIDDEPIVKVLDFGVAKLAATGVLGNSQLTQTGTLLGSPGYMSPEQARGKEVDYRSDLWALAVILFRAVTGVKPFAGDSIAELVIKLCIDPRPVASRLAPDVPPAIDRFFEKAFAASPDDRHQSAMEMATAFAQIAGQPGLELSRTGPSPVAGLSPAVLDTPALSPRFPSTSPSPSLGSSPSSYSPGGSSVGGSSVGASSVGASSMGGSSVGASSVGASSVGASSVGASSVGASSMGASSGGVSSSRTPSSGISPLGPPSVGVSSPGTSSSGVSSSAASSSPGASASPPGASPPGASPPGASSPGASSIAVPRAPAPSYAAIVPPAPAPSPAHKPLPAPSPLPVYGELPPARMPALSSAAAHREPTPTPASFAGFAPSGAETASAPPSADPSATPLPSEGLRAPPMGGFAETSAVRPPDGPAPFGARAPDGPDPGRPLPAPTVPSPRSLTTAGAASRPPVDIKVLVFAAVGATILAIFFALAISGLRRRHTTATLRDDAAPTPLTAIPTAPTDPTAAADPAPTATTDPTATATADPTATPAPTDPASTADPAQPATAPSGEPFGGPTVVEAPLDPAPEATSSAAAPRSTAPTPSTRPASPAGSGKKKGPRPNFGY